MNKSIIINRDMLQLPDGMHNTLLPKVKIYKTSQYEPKSPLVYDDCLILVLQGKKIANLSNKQLTFDCDNYLVVPTTLPLECETYASKELPFICLIVSIDRKLMLETLLTTYEANYKDSKTTKLGIFSDKVSVQIEDITKRLLDILESKEESKILGEYLLRELYYRITKGGNAQFLHNMFLKDKNESKIATAIKTIHENVHQTIHVPTLARELDMSNSSFHNHFKKVTSYSPLQYIKKIRLNHAKELLSSQHMQVVDVAYALGYDTASQFSRDFKNYFGFPPRDVKLF